MAGLGLAIAVVFWYQFFRAPALTTPEAAASVPTTQTDLSTVKSVFQEAEFDIEELAQSIKDVEFNYAEAREVRDPMIPLLGGTSFLEFQDAPGTEAITTRLDENIIYEASRKKVTGIIWDETFPLAVLSELGEPDEIVSEGFEIGGGIRVTSIRHNHVVLSLRLENETIEIVKELKEQ